MTETAQFSFSPDALGHLVSDRLLAVPVYQRSFSWAQSQVEDFWNDLIGAFRQDQAEYFIGNLVLSREGAEGSAVAIIDGQQRLATTVLLLAAIRDEHLARGDDAVAESIDRDFISTFNRRTRENTARLRLNSDDDPFFRRLVVDRVPLQEISPLQGSHELIAGAYDYFRNAVREMADSNGENWAGALADWTEYLTHKARVVVVDVPTEADAFLIFEALNTRGADLTIADLLKNYLFRRSATDLDVVRSGWMAALGSLEMSAEDTVFTTFIRHLWSSKHGATRERLLYSRIKDRITNRVQAVDFSQELRTTARLYAAILNSSHEYWGDLGSNTRRNIETLERLKLEQMRPLMLATMQYFDDEQLKLALRGLVSWGVRGLIVGGIGGGKTERAYCEAAVKVRSGEVKTISELATALSEIIPTDDEFKAHFSRARVTTARLARYYLHSLERTRREEDEPELIPNEDAEQVNLEHILPKNPAPEDWPLFTSEEHKIFLHRLGNMALLSRGPNDRLGNGPWPLKRPVLAESDLLTPQTAAEHDDWTAAVIDERQDSFAALAVTAWPRLPEEA